MRVISNTSPLNYLILIGQIEVLPDLYGQVQIPPAVYEELKAPETPDVVRAWIAHLPGWIEISAQVVTPENSLGHLHAGEREAITLAQQIRADALIIDERRGREEAERRGLRVIGTLGVLAAAHEQGLIELSEAIDQLRKTTFHASPKLLADILRKYQR